MKRCVAGLTLLCLSLATVHTGALGAPRPASGPQGLTLENGSQEGARISRYTYSPYQVYRLYTRVGEVTHIEFGEGEGMAGEVPQIGDSVQWEVGGGIRNLFVKPLRPGIKTSMTVLTNWGSYQFELIAVDGPYHKKVSFSYPARQRIALLDAANEKKPQEPGQPASDSLPPPGPRSPCTLDQLDTGATVTGNAPFRPLLVATSASVTCLKLPRGLVPAVFGLEQGKPVLINNDMLGNLVVVDKPRADLLLKLGKDEVSVTWPDPELRP